MRRIVTIAAIGAAAAGCCGRKVVHERTVTVQHIERRDTTIYRAAVNISGVIHLPRLDTLPFSVITTDSATGATLIQSYSPATRDVTTTVHVPERADTIPRVYERINTETETVKETTVPCEKCRHTLWLLAGVGIGFGLFGLVALLSRWGWF